MLKTQIKCFGDPAETCSTCVKVSCACTHNGSVAGVRISYLGNSSTSNGIPAHSLEEWRPSNCSNQLISNVESRVMGHLWCLVVISTVAFCYNNI